MAKVEHSDSPSFVVTIGLLDKAKIIAPTPLALATSQHVMAQTPNPLD